MDTLQSKARIDELTRLVAHHNHLYFQENSPVISDHEFDALANELKEWRTVAPQHFTDEPKIGEKPSGALKQAVHRHPMLSIENTYSEDGLRAWLEDCQKSFPEDRIQVCVEYKIDGAAVSVEYRHGRLFCAISRGNGVIGDDITHNAATFADLPQKIDESGTILIRGEAYILHEDLVDINKARVATGQPAYKNVRNTASGAIRLQDAEECKTRRVRFMAHGMVEWLDRQPYPVPDTYSETVHRLLALEGIGVPPGSRTVKGVEEAIQAANELVSKIPELPFAVDGVVVKLDSWMQRADLGTTSDSPRWARAYKIIKLEKVTRVNEITWQVGKTGAITPVAELEPVDIDGSTITRSTLHNYAEIMRKDIRVGDYVTVEKAGAVIPYISRVELDRRSLLSVTTPAPTACPACGSPAESTEGVVAIRCGNSHCEGKLAQQLLHFASRDAMYIEGLGEAVVKQLIDSGSVKNTLDLYTLTKDQMLSVAGIGQKTTDTLLANIQASKSKGLACFLYSLSIPLVGQRASTSVANRCESLERIYELSTSDIATFDFGLGAVVNRNLREFWQSDYGASVVSRAHQLGIYTEVPAESKVDVNGKFAGQTIVVTGTMEKYDRSEIEALIVKHGGKAGSSVSKKTSMLVAGPGAGSKLTKANELGVKVISEAEFLTLLLNG